MTLEERYWPKVDKHGPRQPSMDTPCWRWTGATDRKGYGIIRAGAPLPGNLRAHRAALMLAGNDPGEACVLHRCDFAGCVRPSHLFTGTRPDNNADMMRKGRGRWVVGTGEHNGKAKLTDAEVAAVKAAYAAGEGTQTEIARRFGISQTHVSDLVRNKTRIFGSTLKEVHQ